MLDQYKLLSTNDAATLNKNKLEKMKKKIESIYDMIERKLNQYKSHNVSYKNKKLLEDKTRAAIHIQRHVRGFLTRKLLNHIND